MKGNRNYKHITIIIKRIYDEKAITNNTFIIN